MPDRPDLPAAVQSVGNYWYSVIDRGLFFSESANGPWSQLTKDNADAAHFPFLIAAAVSGLGRALPAGPTPAPTPPKRVAKVVRCGAWELAAKGEFLFDRDAGDVGNWHPAQHWTYDRTFTTLAAEAFAGAGDVLPGEAE